MWQCSREVGDSAGPGNSPAKGGITCAFCLSHTSDWMHVCSRHMGSCRCNSSRRTWCTGTGDSRQFSSSGTPRVKALQVSSARSVVAARDIAISDRYNRPPCVGVGGKDKCLGAAMRNCQAWCVRPGGLSSLSSLASPPACPRRQGQLLEFCSSRRSGARYMRTCHADGMPWSSAGLNHQGLLHGHPRSGHFP